MAVTLLDKAAGLLNNIEAIRQQALLFNQEVTELKLRTRVLVPGTSHCYEEEGVYDDELLGIEKQVRWLRVDQNSTILGPSFGQKDESEITITFLGGSTTECNEVSEGNRFPYLVGEILGETLRKNVRGINAGLRAHTTIDSINLLINRSFLQSGDYIVLMHNLNDRLVLWAHDSYDGIPSPWYPSSLARIRAESRRAFVSVWEYLKFHSNIIFMVDKKFEELFIGWRGTKNYIDERNIDFPDSKILDHKRQFQSNLRIFVGIVKAFGKIPVLMTQPLGKSSKQQDLFNEAIREVTVEEDVLLIDLEASFPKEKEELFFPDKVHLNEQGSIIAARKISNTFYRSFFVKSVQNYLSMMDLSKLRSLCKPGPMMCEGVKDLHLSKPKQIIRGAFRYPVVSEDGRFFAFQGNDKGKEVIIVKDLHNKSSDHFISSENEDMRHPVFRKSPDGMTQIVFACGSEIYERLYVKTLGKDDNKILLPEITMTQSIPTVGLDGNIAFSGTISNFGYPDLFLLNCNGDKVLQLTRTSWEEWRPTFSPNGKTIYYIANPDSQFDLFALDIDSRGTRKVYGSPVDEWDPAISPDGGIIAFSSSASGNWDLWVCNTSEDCQETAVPIIKNKTNEWDANFDYDGRLLLYAVEGGELQQGIWGVCLYGEED